jgi:hypothetical protein
LLPRQQARAFLHIARIFKLKSAGPGHGHATAGTVNGQRTTKAIFDIRSQRQRRSLAYPAGDPFKVGEICKSVVDRTIHGDGDFAAAQHHGLKLDHLHLSCGGAFVNARRQDAGIRLIDKLFQ